MANNTPTSLNSAVPESQGKIEGRKMNVHTGIASLALMIAVAGNVNAQTMQIATNTEAPTPTTSVQRGGQVVEIDGKKMTFSEISALPKEQKDAILNNRAIMKPSRREAFDEFELQVANQEGKAIDARIQVANQDNQTKLQVEKVANQEGKAIDARIQVANQEATKIDLENIVKMKAKLARGMKLNTEDKSYLLALEQSKRPPVDDLAKILLSNPRNFA